MLDSISRSSIRRSGLGSGRCWGARHRFGTGTPCAATENRLLAGSPASLPLRLPHLRACRRGLLRPGGAFLGRPGLGDPFAADGPAAFSALSSSVLEELQHVRKKLLGRDHARSAAGGSGRIREQETGDGPAASRNVRPGRRRSRAGAAGTLAMPSPGGLTDARRRRNRLNCCAWRRH